MLQQNKAGATFAAARKMYLPDVAEALGFKFKKTQHKFFSNHCPSCGEGRSGGNGTSIFQDKDGVWRWNCFCCGKGGTSIDFVVEAKGLSSKEAAEYLVNEKIAPSISQERIAGAVASAEATNKALQEAIGILLRFGHSNVAKVRDYLFERKIGERVQTDAFRRGQLRMLPDDPHECFQWLVKHIGEGRLRASGLWKPGSKWPAIAFRPLVGILPGSTSVEFRLARDVKDENEPKAIRYGSLRWPWWWKNELMTGKIDQIIVVEGSMDLWSLVEMGADKQMHIMGIPGTGTWNKEWLKQAADKNGCHCGIVGIDNDPTGDKVAETMVKEIKDSGLNSYRILPETKDWNHDLRSGRTTF